MLWADLIWGEHYVPGMGRAPLLALLCLFGAAIGSFLNVVIYRLPRGESLLYPPSRCPGCGRAIRWYDNVPVLGWLFLKGRCRDCGAPISIRYPLVEALVAVVSLLIAWSEALAPTTVPGADSVYVVAFGTYAWHLWLMCALIAAAWMIFDGQRPPVRMIGSVLAVGLIAGTVWPELRGSEEGVADAWRGAIDGGLGLSAGLVLAGLSWPAWVHGGNKSFVGAGLVNGALLAVVGVYLGVGGAAVVAAVGMAGYVLSSISGRLWPAAGHFGWAAWLAASTLVWVITGGAVLDRLAPGSNDLQRFVAGGGLMALLAIVARLAGGPISSVPQRRESEAA